MTICGYSRKTFITCFPWQWQSNDLAWAFRKILLHTFHNTGNPMTLDGYSGKLCRMLSMTLTIQWPYIVVLDTIKYLCVGQDLVRFGVKSEYITISTILQLSSFFTTIMTPVIMSDDVRIHFWYVQAHGVIKYTWIKFCNTQSLFCQINCIRYIYNDIHFLYVTNCHEI